MELYTVYDAGKMVIALLDDEIRIVKPVYDYLNFQKQKDRAINTLKANGYDLKLFWEFLAANGYEYNKVTPHMISSFIDYLRAGDTGSLRQAKAQTGR